MRLGQGAAKLPIDPKKARRTGLWMCRASSLQDGSDPVAIITRDAGVWLLGPNWIDGTGSLRDDAVVGTGQS
jgi:hypothetical protein